MTRFRWAAAVLVLATMAKAQDAKPIAKPLVFDVVSVKENQSHAMSWTLKVMPDGWHMVNVELFQVVRLAYGMPDAAPDKIVGLPDWAKDLRFDVEAKVSPEDAAAFTAATKEEKWAMLRTVVEDRFKVKARKEDREQPVYLLVVAKGGPKMKVADPANSYENGITKGSKVSGQGAASSGMRGTTFHTEFQAGVMEQLVMALSMLAERAVIDKTGLTGKYDIKLDVTPPWVRNDSEAPAPRVFAAVEDQLGLKLEAARGPVKILVVDHVEQPTAN